MLLVVVGCATGEVAGAGTEVVLDTAVAAIAELDRVVHVVELPDGRLLGSDGSALLLIDFDTGAVDTIGRQGQGPGEYTSVSWPSVHGGRIWALDPMQQRLLSWELDGTPASVVTFPQVIIASANATDTLGNIYYEQPSTTGFVVTGQEADSTRSQDSTWVYRISPPAPGRDTIARLFEVGWETMRFGGGVARLRLDYITADRWGVLPDGTVWVARGQENRVDRRLPDGNWIIGTPRPWTPVKTTEADKRFLRGFRGAGTAPDSLVRPMVETKGPFSDAVASADGEVWLRTHQPAGYTTERYAVFPVSGPSTRTVVMKRDESVVGITESWVYSTLEDESGLYTLRRYRRP